ncbi:MAG: MBL fold metallo-hydrolase [Candidatus Spechtbacteria bacterium SB0662_bin_43]|uniref:MBL fold metallo-hydrolase n=1 Tax=Candidatus Spechtbacteria bacterium SB0662_bin_43 TaxID=2604897 RepID=A0A845D9P2_9BACT|nr:MBL fold metallo-hydrolase [Candidatus Spechtbacteria bacterium SB0662_bin_43]
MAFVKNHLLFFIALLAFVAVSLFAFVVNTRDPELVVHFLNVGQGDAIFVEMPTGHTLLIDGGLSGSETAYIIGSLLPFYERDIDVVIATHLDSDHIGGLISVLSYFDIGTIVVPQRRGDTTVLSSFWYMVDKEQSNVVTGEQGMKIAFGDDIVLEILSPASDGLYFSENQSSIVAKLSYKNDSFLFTGDIDQRIERSLLARTIDVSADVLKVAHHGSASSSLPAFIEAVSPTIAVIQVGKNSYGHPHKDVIYTLKDTTILRNDIHGHISIKSNGNSL